MTTRDKEGIPSYSVIVRVDQGTDKLIEGMIPKAGHDLWLWQQDRHITLASPGKITDKRLDQLKRRLRDSAAIIQPFDVSCDSLRTFFNTAAMNRDGYPIVVWASPEPESWLKLQFVHADIVKHLQNGFGVGRLERLAHITIGRAPLEARDEALELVKKYNGNLGIVMPFREIVLMRNVPDPAQSSQYRLRGGYSPRSYEEVETFRLGKPSP